jgi:hypothetical protein
MNKSINTIISQESEGQVTNLTSMVNETIAFGMNHNSKQTFTSADLWNIQRNKRCISVRRISF